MSDVHRPLTPKLQAFVDAVAHSDLGIPDDNGSRCPAGKDTELRRCPLCGWTGKRADTSDLGWCPKCRGITEELSK